MHSGRHAAHDERLLPDGDRGHARHHLHPDGGLYDNRRIFTDGRDWPAELEPSFPGYSIGHWIDSDGDGRYDVLEVETRGFKGPRVLDTTGLPLHDDNQTIVKERIYLDKSDPTSCTTRSPPSTTPYTALDGHQELPPRGERAAGLARACLCRGEPACGSATTAYFLSADGLLMPAKKDQPPPDLKYFQRSAR